ncbi:MAG TPA: energy transducer TonB [Thermodesulfobacteriota bacterium]|nr:energy transducer TonB [Thermodesulfobacteriota bacterium]
MAEAMFLSFIETKQFFIPTEKESSICHPPNDTIKKPATFSEPRLRAMLALSFAVHCVVLAIFIFIPGMQNRIPLNPIAYSTLVSVINLNDLPGSEYGQQATPQPPPEQKKGEVKQAKPSGLTNKKVLPHSPPASMAIRPWDSTIVAAVACSHSDLKTQSPPEAGEDARSSSGFDNEKSWAADKNNTPSNSFALGKGIGSGGSSGKGRSGNNGVKVQEDYFTIVRLKIEKHKTYPRFASIRQICGTVVIHFIITPEGAAKEIDIVQSSGSSVLDQAGLKAVKDASPFPKPPVEFFQTAVSIEVPIVFELI